jgi:hypothetical protein
MTFPLISLCPVCLVYTFKYGPQCKFYRSYGISLRLDLFGKTNSITAIKSGTAATTQAELCRYIFYIEAKDSLTNSKVKNLSSLMDKELCKANISYGRHRSKGCFFTILAYEIPLVICSHMFLHGFLWNSKML